MDQYLTQLNLEVAEGRAAIAQQLHSIRAKSAEVSQKPSKSSMSRGSTAATRMVDSWSTTGAGGAWTRAHRTPRRALFTPFKVAGGPDREIRMKRYRITSGTYIISGDKFKITDDWLKPGNAHRLLKASWTGSTTFHEIPEYIEETMNGNILDSPLSDHPT